MERMPYTWCQEPWELLAGRGLYWPRHQALLVADLHLGKELVFRKSGLAIPEGATQETLERLDRLLEATSARSLWILGDLFHARSGLSEQLERWLVAWRQRHEAITIELVAGNHDRGTRTLCERLAIGWRPEPWEVDGIALRHHPSEPTGASDRRGKDETPARAGDISEIEAPFIAGHLHPKVALPKVFGITGSWPCFQFSTNGMILPSLGEFTGGQRRSDFSGPAIAIVGNTLVRVG